MKLGDIKIGSEYGAHDEPQSRHVRDSPRQVKVLEIVEVEVEQWSGGGFTNTRKQVKRKHVKVEVLDALVSVSGSWYRTHIRNAEKGDTIVIEPRNLVALWRDLAPGIAAKAKAEQADIVAKENMEARVKALTGKREGVWVRVRHGEAYEVQFQGKALERLLELAEKGAAA